MPSLLSRLVADDHQAASGSFNAPVRPAQFERLAGHNRRDGMAHMHGIGIHDPGHDLLVGVDVGTGNIFFRPQQLHQFRRVPSGEALQFTLGHLVRIANHSPGRAAERDIHHRAFPRHPTGQRASFVKSDVGGITNAALGRPAIDRVLHPESGKYLQAPVVQLYRDMHDNFAAGLAQISSTSLRSA